MKICFHLLLLSPNEQQWIMGLQIRMGILIAWALYDVIDLRLYPWRIIKKTSRKIEQQTKTHIEQAIATNLAQITIHDLPKECQGFTYFEGLKPKIEMMLRNLERAEPRFAAGVYERNRKVIAQQFFVDPNSIKMEPLQPNIKEDLQLIDYKLSHRKSEIDFALYKFDHFIKSILGKEIEPLLIDMLTKHDAKADRVRKAIIKDQDAIATLGISSMKIMDIIEVIIDSGADFNVNKITPKAISIIAKDAPRDSYGLFCDLTFRAADSRVDQFYDIFECRPETETVPIDFLRHAIDWIRGEATPHQMNMLKQRLDEVEKELIKFPPADASGKLTATKSTRISKGEVLLDQIIQTHMHSREAALQYLGCSQQASNAQIAEAIRVKVSEGKGHQAAATNRDAKLNVEMNIHFVVNKLSDFLLKKKVIG